MRRHFIDNLRWLVVLALFPYHTFMVFNNFGESFYVKGAAVPSLSAVVAALWPWLMPLLFTLAGISAAYALQIRSPKEFAAERVRRLLIPLVAGVLLLVPLQTYIAERFHNGYTGGYLAQYVLFFTKPTDLSGYNGGFTPAHLWFVAYLFVISLAALPLMAWGRKRDPAFLDRIPAPLLPLLFVVPSVSQMLLDIQGKSVGEYLAFFLLGFFLLSRDAVQIKLQKYRFFFLGAALLFGGLYLYFGRTVDGIAIEFLYGPYAWIAVLALLGLGKQSLDFSNRVTVYLSAASYPVYLIHQQWIVVCAYFALRLTGVIWQQILLILLPAAAATFLTYEIFRRNPVTRFLFGIKQAPKNNARGAKSGKPRLD